MRDVLGMSNDLEGIWQSVWVGWLRASMGKLRLGGQAATHNLVRGSPVQHALASHVVGLVEAFEQRLQVTMAVDRDPEHLPLHPPIEALHEAVGLRRVGLRLSMVQLQLAASLLKTIGRKQAFLQC